MSDERDSAGSAGEGTDTDATDDTHGRTAVVTRPARPTGKRSRRGAVDVADDEVADAPTDTESAAAETKETGTKTGKTTTKKADKKSGGNPVAYVINYLKQVVAELRKVIWPSRKQMISYTTVVLVFLAFMVALIGGVDFGLARLVMLVFG